MNYFRHLEQFLKRHLEKRKEILLLLGARQVGKTTLLKRLFPTALFLVVDNEPIRKSLNRYDAAVYRQLIPTNSKIVIIDEIHLLDDPGRAAKIIYDQMPEIKLIITGSSSLRIKNRTSESLAGRKIEYQLYPLTLSEYLYQKGIREEKDFPILTQLLEHRTLPLEKHYLFDLSGILDNLLIYGLYPALLNQPNDQLYLKNLVDSVVFKDLFDLSLIENRTTAFNLLRLLSYQIGSLVNYSELANKLNVSVQTVKRYIDLFEQSFILFKIFPFSKRARNEIVKMPKIYFYDVGLRNALIDNFQSLNLRPDAGALWENFVIGEILKANYYGNFGGKLHFWRTKQGSEIDLVFLKDGQIIGLEIKTSRKKVSATFKNHYSKATTLVVTKKNLY